jgi:hypothetical protein
VACGAAPANSITGRTPRTRERHDAPTGRETSSPRRARAHLAAAGTTGLDETQKHHARGPGRALHRHGLSDRRGEDEAPACAMRETEHSLEGDGGVSRVPRSKQGFAPGGSDRICGALSHRRDQPAERHRKARVGLTQGAGDEREVVVVKPKSGEEGIVRVAGREGLHEDVHAAGRQVQRSRLATAGAPSGRLLEACQCAGGPVTASQHELNGGALWRGSGPRAWRERPTHTCHGYGYGDKAITAHGSTPLKENTVLGHRNALSSPRQIAAGPARPLCATSTSEPGQVQALPLSMPSSRAAMGAHGAE